MSATYGEDVIGRDVDQSHAMADSRLPHEPRRSLAVDDDRVGLGEDARRFCRESGPSEHDHVIRRRIERLTFIHDNDRPIETRES